jgi:chromosome segregation ATPase
MGTCLMNVPNLDMHSCSSKLRIHEINLNSQDSDYIHIPHTESKNSETPPQEAERRIQLIKELSNPSAETINIQRNKLSSYQESSIFAVADQNMINQPENLDIIDIMKELSVLKANLKEIPLLCKKITSLQREQGEISTTVTSLQLDNSTLSTRVTSLELDNATLSTTVTSLQLENGTIKDENKKLSTRVTSLELENGTLKDENKKLSTRVTSLELDNATLSTTVTSLQLDNATLSTTVTSLQLENGTLKDENKKLRFDVDFLKEKNLKIENTLYEMQGKLATLNKNFTSNMLELDESLKKFFDGIPQQSKENIANENVFEYISLNISNVIKPRFNKLIEIITELQSTIDILKKEQVEIKLKAFDTDIAIHSLKNNDLNISERFLITTMENSKEVHQVKADLNHVMQGVEIIGSQMKKISISEQNLETFLEDKNQINCRLKNLENILQAIHLRYDLEFILNKVFLRSNSISFTQACKDLMKIVRGCLI